MQRAHLVAGGVVLIGVLAAAAVTVAPGVWENVVLDNASHGRACDELPTQSALAAVLARHQAAVTEIEAVDPATVDVSATAAPSCPNGYFLLVTYGSHEQRTTIEGILERTGLGDAPVELRNI